MDEANRAMCFALRNPPRGQKPTKLGDIQKLVRKTDGKRPTLQAIQQAASTFNDKRAEGQARWFQWHHQGRGQEDLESFSQVEASRPLCGFQIGAQSFAQEAPSKSFQENCNSPLGKKRFFSREELEQV